MANSGPIVPQNYASLYLRIHSKDFFFKHCRWSFPINRLLGQMGNFGPVGAQNYTSLYSAIQSKKFFQNHQMDNFDTFVAQNYASLYLRICCKVSFKLCNIIGHSKQIRFTQVKSKKLSFYLKSCRFLESTVPLINAYYKKTSVLIQHACLLMWPQPIWFINIFQSYLLLFFELKHLNTRHVFLSSYIDMSARLFLKDMVFL